MITNTIGEILEKTTQQYPNNDAIIYPGKIRLSYEKFNKYVDTLAKALIAIFIYPSTLSTSLAPTKTIPIP